MCRSVNDGQQFAKTAYDYKTYHHKLNSKDLCDVFGLYFILKVAKTYLNAN